jgi:hypothetical protein
VGKQVKIKKIYSKINQNDLLHIVVKMEEFDDGRVDMVPETNFIQCSALRLEKNKTFKPHKHIFKKRSYDKQIAQESWVVIKGKVKCIFYDLDDNILTTEILNSGDLSFTLQGGHNYQILESDTLVYEFKTGPYEGQQHDKEFIH